MEICHYIDDADRRRSSYHVWHFDLVWFVTIPLCWAVWYHIAVVMDKIIGSNIWAYEKWQNYERKCGLGFYINMIDQS